MSVSLDADLAQAPQAPAWMATAWRYGLTTMGPVATSGAHFLASLLFVRTLPADAFGLFSFVLVIVPFAMSMMGALLVIPITQALTAPPGTRAAITASCLKMNVVLTGATMLGVFGLLIAAKAPLLAALLLALFGGVFALRWFARCQAYVENRVTTAVASDLVYAASLTGGLGVLALRHHLDLTDGAGVMLLAALVSLLPLGRKFFLDQAAALKNGSLRRYAATFRDVTRWSLLGVILTEMTVNAHAYLVTFVAGAGPFALLALGMLLMRPASLMQSALPDLERPLMTRQIAAMDWAGLTRTRRTFAWALLAALGFTLLLDAALLTEFPSLLLKKGYGLHDVLMVGTLSVVIMAVRALRTPVAVQLQATGAFRQLAALGLKTGALSVLATLVLLLTLGTIASLGGVLLGETAILYYCHRLLRDWEARNV